MRFSMACKLVEKIRKTKTASGFEAVKQHSAHVILNALDFISILFFRRGGWVGRGTQLPQQQEKSFRNNNKTTGLVIPVNKNKAAAQFVFIRWNQASTLFPWCCETKGISEWSWTCFGSSPSASSCCLLFSLLIRRDRALSAMI